MKKKKKTIRELFHKDRPRPKWTPFQDITAQLSSPMARQLGIDAKAALLASTGNLDSQVFRNSRYQVIRTPYTLDDGEIAYNLSIKSIDNDAIHDWRDFQRIKNELCGKECEAVELYPAESRLVDTSNQYYLFAMPEGFKFPFGFQARMIIENPKIAGAKQRPFEPDNRPTDISTINEEVDKRELLKAQQKLLEGKSNADRMADQ